MANPIASSYVKREAVVGGILLAMFTSFIILGIILLKSLLTLPGSIALSLLLVWMILKEAIRISIFPGSCFLFRGSIGSKCGNTIHKWLQKDLKSLLNSPVFDSKLEQVHLSLTKHTEVLASLSSKSKYQKTLEILLNNLLSDLEAKRCLKTNCEEALLHLRKRSCLFYWRRPQSLFSSFSYIRAFTIHKFKGVPIQLKARDGCLIDCLWLPCEEPRAPCVLFCNTNAGFYEAACCQSDWADFYLKRNVNMMLWNYRGFGCSQGCPSIQLLVEDGAIIVDYLLANRLARKIALHGHSLGGAVAVGIARIRKVDFLLADRTFWSIGYVAHFNFGRLARWVIWLAGHDIIDVAKEFIEVECCKVITADFQDTMIPDFASLKSGVAFNLIYQELAAEPYTLFLDKNIDRVGYILFKNEMEASIRSIDKLVKLEESLENNCEDLDKWDSMYLSLDGSTAKLNDLSSDIAKSVLVLDELCVGGKPISSVANETDKHLSLLLWLVSFDLWGCLRVHYTYAKVENSMKQLIKIAEKRKKSESKLRSVAVGHIKNLLALLSKVLKHIRLRDQGIIYPIVHRGKRLNKNIRYYQAGQLIALNCGHLGEFSFTEIKEYEKTLVDAGFILS